MRESQLDTLDLSHTSPEILRQILHYLYTLEIDYELLGENVLEVLMASALFSLPKLQSELEWLIAGNLTAENVGSVAQVASHLSATKLLQLCVDFEMPKPQRALTSSSMEIIENDLKQLDISGA